MAQVVPYQTAAGERYRVRYRTPDRRQTDKRGRRRPGFLKRVERKLRILVGGADSRISDDRELSHSSV